MALDMIFSVCMGLAVLGWLALVAAPIARPPLILIARLVALVLAAAYFVQLFTITQPVPGASFSTLAGVTALFSQPGNVMLGWTHFLAFDLFVGSWEVEDGHANGIAHWALVVPLVLTFMFGPIGLLTYAVIRTVHLRRTRNRFF